MRVEEGLYLEGVDPRLALEVLGDPDRLVEGLPYLVGIRGGRVVLLFRRALFRFSDAYRLTARRSGDRVVVELEGERSTIRLSFWSDPGGTLWGRAVYTGPRGWVVGGRLPGLVRGLLEYAESEARKLALRRRVERVTTVPAGLLADRMFTAGLIMKSKLVGSVEWPRGEPFTAVLARLERMGVTSRYRVVYLSSVGGGPRVRVLIFDGTPVAAVVEEPGRPARIGVETLESLEGGVRFRVYASMLPPERLLASIGVGGRG